MTGSNSPPSLTVPAEGLAVAVDFPWSIARAFPDVFPPAWDAVGRSLGAVEGRRFYGLDVLQGLDLDNHRQMEADPSLRELIFSVSTKPSRLR